MKTFKFKDYLGAVYYMDFFDEPSALKWLEEWNSKGKLDIFIGEIE